MSVFIPGQRWISESEPELGLGTIMQTGDGRVHVTFTAAGESRTYAVGQAPLKRVRFRAGDKIKTQADQEFIIKEVIEQQGLLIYIGDQQQLSEAQLNDRVSLLGAQERLFAGRFDNSATFVLRRRTLELLHRFRQSPVRGFVGGRIDLIPHQLYIAQEVANRHAPRVMLSDEVGLGKTIEACLILHRLLLSGRANRILVLVPESLVHQWFVEMLRRFNVWLHIFDAERCASIEAGEPGANPFLDDQLVLTSIDFLAADPRIHYKEKRAITLEEHQKIIAAEVNPERKTLYQLCWHLGASQGDTANLKGEDVDWTNGTVSFTRKKTGVPVLVHLGGEALNLFKDLPGEGPLFPYLSRARAGDRATEFASRCRQLGIIGVTLHSYRYAWAERAKTVGYRLSLVLPDCTARCIICRMVSSSQWCRCDYLEFPPEGLIVWTTDGSVVRRGTWHYDWPHVELENSIWKDTEGALIKVTHWLFIEDSAASPPDLPELKRKG